jgi:hypothetical protein
MGPPELKAASALHGFWPEIDGLSPNGDYEKQNRHIV